MKIYITDYIKTLVVAQKRPHFRFFGFVVSYACIYVLYNLQYIVISLIFSGLYIKHWFSDVYVFSFRSLPFLVLFSASNAIFPLQYVICPFGYIFRLPFLTNAISLHHKSIDSITN